MSRIILPSSRRTLLKLGLAGAAVTAFGAPLVRAKSAEVRVGFQKGAITLTVLKAQGIFEQRLTDQGYQVSWTEFPAGPPMLEALNAGAIDLGLVGSPPPIFAQAAGADLIYVLSTSPSSDSEGIIVPADSAIETPADLAGKKVAVTKGSSANALLVRALEFGGLKWGDAEPVYLLPADAKAAFEGGSVDAWSIWDPYFAAQEAASGARTVATTGSVGAPSRGYYVASRPFATENQEALDTLLTTLNEAETWAETHGEEVAKLIADETGLPLEIMLAVEERRQKGVEAITPEIVAEQQKVADLFFSIGLIPQKLDISSATLLDSTNV